MRPALTLETKEREYPKYAAKSRARPSEASSHSANLFMIELSKRVTVKSSERVTCLGHDDLMENNIFDVRRQRLAEWMLDRKLSQVDVANRTGKTKSYISLILSAGKSFGEKTARLIENKLFMPKLWLDGQTDEHGLSPIVEWNRVEDLPSDTFAIVPRVSIQLSAGGGVVAQEEEELLPLAFRKDWLIKKNISAKSNLRTCAVRGDSMSPYLEDEDTVLIDMGQNIIKDNNVYAIEHSGEVRIKRLAKTFNGGIVIRSDNRSYPDETLGPVDAQQLRVLGLCVWRAG